MLLLLLLLLLLLHILDRIEADDLIELRIQIEGVIGAVPARGVGGACVAARCASRLGCGRHLWCHGTVVSTVPVRRTYSRGGPGGKLPCTQGAGTRSPTYSTEAPGHTCQHRRAHCHA